MPDQNASAFERWQRLSQLLEEALARPAHDRLAYVRAQCHDAPELAREIETLLEAQTAADGPLEALAAALGVSWSEADGQPPAGRRIGPYELVREVGRGGMGVVYLARRADGQYAREVALKITQSPVFDPQLRERFLAEREILANLSHHNIASLFDGGVTDEGHPYFTMEYVDGQPIDRHCDERALDVRARVRLFLQVCEAVSAAHRSLVVHRDLKPSNVLVSAAGDVKLLDFGIAKLLDPMRSLPEHTQAAGRMFTRDYASPEQVRGVPVTTASDVYSLGALLYRLLTGTTAHQFTGDSPSDVERAICESEPSRPSVAATTPRHRRALAGDLDNIVLKALSKEPQRRYASVELLAQDLDRYLRRLPVAARPDTWTYRTRTFVRRYRLPVAAAALLVISLVAGAVATTIQAQRARAAAERAQRVSMLLTDVFELAEPGRLQGGTITARELLNRANDRITTELAADPDAQGMMFGVIGRLYGSLALFDEAERAAERSLQLRERTHGVDSLEYATALTTMAVLRSERNDDAKAEQLHRRALELRQRLGAPPHEIAESLEGIGKSLSELGKADEAELPLRQALQLRRMYGGERGTELVDTLHELALTLLRKGNRAAAEPLFREAIDLSQRLPKRSAKVEVDAMLNLARLVDRFDRKPAEAAVLYRDALGRARELYPPTHPDIGICLGELARALREAGQLDEAESAAAEAVNLLNATFGPRHRESIIATQRLAGIVGMRGRTADAERMFTETLDNGNSLLGVGHPIVLSVVGDYADFLEAQGRFADALHQADSGIAAARRRFGEQDVYFARGLARRGRLYAAMNDLSHAEEDFRRVLSVRERLHPAGHWRVGEAKVDLGSVLTRARKYEEAEPLLLDASRTLEKASDAPNSEKVGAIRELVALYESSGRSEDADRYRALLPAVRAANR